MIVRPLKSKKKGKEEPTFVNKGHTDAVLSLAVLPNGDIVSGSADSTIRLWRDVNSKRRIILLLLHLQRLCLPGIFGQNRRHIFLLQRTWNSLDCIAVLEGHTGSVFCLAVLPDGVTLASGSWDKTVKLWNTKDCVCVQTLH